MAGLQRGFPKLIPRAVTLKPVTESRERIVEAAAELFLGGSFHKVGIAEICEVARVNKGTFYHFFASKLDLLLEVIDRYVANCGDVPNFVEKAKAGVAG